MRDICLIFANEDFGCTAVTIASGFIAIASNFESPDIDLELFSASSFSASAGSPGNFA